MARADGQLSAAVYAFTRAAGIAERTCPADHPLLARSWTELADAYRLSGETVRADSLDERASELEQRRRRRGNCDLRTWHAVVREGNQAREDGQTQAAAYAFTRAVGVAERTCPQDHPLLIRSWTMLAVAYRELGEPLRALALHEQAAQLRRRLDRPVDEEHATQIFEMAETCRAAGQHSRSRELHEQSLAIREQVLGDRHADVAMSRLHLAKIYEQMRLDHLALPLYKSIADSQLSRLGANHDRTLESMQRLADTYGRLGNLHQALFLHERVLTWRQQVSSDDPEIASAMSRVATTLLALGDSQRPLLLLEHALDLRERLLAPGDTRIVASVSALTSFHLSLGSRDARRGRIPSLLARAREHLENAELIGPADGVVLSMVGLHHALAGESDLALSLLERAQSLLEGAPEDTVSAEFAHSIADAYHLLGRFDRALSLHERALSMRLRILGPEHLDVARSLDEVGRAHSVLSRPELALRFFQRASSLRAQVLPSGHPDMVESLNRLGDTHLMLGEPERALPLFERAVALCEGGSSVPSRRMRTLLGRIGEAYQVLGEPARALPFCERRLALAEEQLGSEHPDLPAALLGLAAALKATGDVARALPLEERATAIHERVRFDDHPDVAYALGELADSLTLLGAHERAMALYSRVARMLRSLRNVERSDVEVAYRRLAGRVVRLARAFPRATRLAAGVVLDLGTIFEEERTRARLVASSPDLGPLRDRLAGLRRAYEELLRSRQEEDTREWAERLYGLTADIERIERRLLVQVPRIHEEPVDSMPSRIRQSLSGDAAFLTLVSTPPEEPERRDGWTYTALVVTREFGAELIPLGSIVQLDECAAVYRDTLDGLRVGNVGHYRRDAEALYRLLFEPLAHALRGIKTLYVIPEGPFDVIPVVALASDNEYLVDRGYHVAYFGAATEILRVRRHPHHGELGPSLVLAPFVGEGPHELAAAGKEAAVIGSLLNTSPRVGPVHASVEVVRAARRPHVLHIATHGEFEEAPRLLRSEGFVPAASRSSLLFPSSRDGLALQDRVSAYEISQLDLHGTQLVVLSACNSAQGAAETGQSAHGLRRAFLVAGAETVVAAMWRVDDGSTEVFMRDYYTRIVQHNQPRLEALHDTMREMRRCNPNPRYWAPFVLLGETGPLDLPPSARSRP